MSTAAFLSSDERAEIEAELAYMDRVLENLKPVLENPPAREQRRLWLERHLQERARLVGLLGEAA